MVRTTPSRATKSNDYEEESEKPPAEKQKTPPKKGKTSWSPAEDEALMMAVEEDRKRRQADGDEEDEEDWDEISDSVPGKTAVQCFRRYTGQLKAAEASAPAASARRSRDDRDQGDDDSPASKKSKTDSGEDDWTADELFLLKTLVEHYSDSKFLCSCANSTELVLSFDSHVHPIRHINHSLSSLERDCSQLP